MGSPEKQGLESRMEIDVWLCIWIWEMCLKSHLTDLIFIFKDVPRFFIQTLWKLEDISALQRLCLGNGT